MKRFRNWILFLIVVFIWGFNWVLLKIGLGYVDPLIFTVHRFMLSALALSPLLIPLRDRIPRDWKSHIGLMLLGVFYALGIALIHTGLTYEKAGIGAILTYTQPLFVFCMAVPLLKDEAKASRLIGMVIGFLGVVVLSLKNIGFIESFTYSTFLLVIGAFLWAASTVYYKKFLTHVNPLVTSIFQLGWGFILLTPSALLFKNFYFPLVTDYIIVIIFVSLAAFALAGTIWIFLLREEDVTVLSSSSLMVPIVAFFFGFIFLGESVELRTFIGASLILGGVYLVNKKGSN